MAEILHTNEVGMRMLKQALLKDEKNETNHIAESYTGIYAMHKYWSKKPHNIVRDFVLKYTHEGEIVLDPFCGSGISITESILTGRKAIGIDINPVAIFIAKQMINKISTKLVEKEFRKLESEIKDEINSFYTVKRGEKSFVGTHFIWKGSMLTEVRYKNKGRTHVAEPTDEDITLASSFSYEKIPYSYPQHNFFHNSRINANRENHVYDLFTPRNLMGLSLLMDRIEKIKNDSVREFFKFCFTASVGQASKMVFVIKRRGKFNGNTKKTRKKEVGSWVIGYWIPKENFEINVWNCFENRYKRIMKAKRTQENAYYSIREAETFEELLGSQNVLFVNEPAQKILKEIPDNSVDYVITDPPHGNRQPYLELSMMWNSWLKKNVNYGGEIVVSESKDRNKDIHDYYKLLGEVFVEIERVLKPNHYFSLMFNSLDDETWMNLLQNMNNLNFTLKKVETLGYSAHSVVQDTRKAGLKTDFVLTFEKILNNESVEQISIKNGEQIKNFIEACFDEHGADGLYAYQVLNFLVSKLLEQNKFFRLSQVLDVLEMNFERKGNKFMRKDVRLERLD